MKFFIILLTLLSLCGFIWVFDPILQFIDKSKVDVFHPTFYTSHVTESSNTEVDLSVVLPAYNEEERIVSTMDSSLPFLIKFCEAKGFNFEVIVVDDGSTDQTVNVVKKYQTLHPDVVKIYSLSKNQGKGGAMKLGIKKALGKYILMADADGATEISDLQRLYDELQRIPSNQNTADEPAAKMVIGSRAHLADKSIAQRAFYRTILMKGFHFLVTILTTKNIHDTQCGFKLFTRAAAKDIFADLHLYRWAFDIEVIYRAEAMNIPIREVSVNWREVEGSKLIKSKLDVVTTSLTMARDMFCVRVAYIFGIWSLPVRSHSQHTTNSKDEM